MLVSTFALKKVKEIEKRERPTERDRKSDKVTDTDIQYYLFYFVTPPWKAVTFNHKLQSTFSQYIAEF